MSFHDEFSKQAGLYTQYRPHYPGELYDYLAGVAPSRCVAWDSGTGNGQAAVDLAERFDLVLASDPSSEQLQHAVAHPRVRYFAAAAEQAPIADHSVDLVAAAEAAHWFVMPRFVSETRRVLRDGGVVAVWGYSFHTSGDPRLDSLLDALPRQTLADYWSPKVKELWAGYADLYFPYEELPAPRFEVRMEVNLREWLAYASTWSASQKYSDAHGGRHPAEAVYPELRRAWGDPDERRVLVAPLFLRVGKVARSYAAELPAGGAS